jgi:hypothetical protein
MYNKKTISILPLIFLLSVTAFAQNTIIESDTTIRVKVIKEDKNLNSPKLKNPQQLCKQLKGAWGDYLKSNPKIVKEFGLDSDTANYFSSIRIKILKNGIVSDVTQRSSQPNIGYVCYKALKTTLRKSVWVASYRKYVKTEKYLAATVLVYFTITKVGLEKIYFTDLKTSQSFCECSD